MGLDWDVNAPGKPEKKAAFFSLALCSRQLGVYEPLQYLYRMVVGVQKGHKGVWKSRAKGAG
jgi:hypothetical protein